MANEDYKNGKLVEIVREFNNTGNQYEVNGIKQAIAVPFWRRENDKFQVIPKGSYSFINEAGNDYLKILDSTILQQATQFQIVYDYLQLSSKYIEDFPDVVVLTEKYNQLVDDTTNLFSYLKSVGLIADTLQMTKVLSALEPLTTWYMDEKGEIRTLPVSDLYGKFQQLIDTLHKEIKKLLDIDLKVSSDKLKKQLAEHVLALTNELNKHKTELNDYTQEKIKEIQATCERLIDLAFNKLTKANNILELQSRKNLKVGDIVEVLGYYTAGDGAGHKRIIKAEDDGSGVQLSNGLWANIVKSNIYHSNWFGANKTVDVTDIFEKMISYNKPLIVNQGEYNISKHIFDIQNNIIENNGTFKNKKIIKYIAPKEEKPKLELIGTIIPDSNVIIRAMQGACYNDVREEYVVPSATTNEYDLSVLYVFDKNLNYLRKKELPLDHATQVAFKKDTNEYIVVYDFGYTDIDKHNYVAILNADTLEFKRDINIGSVVNTHSYDNDLNILVTFNWNGCKIFDENFNLIKEITVSGNVREEVVYQGTAFYDGKLIYIFSEKNYGSAILRYFDLSGKLIRQDKYFMNDNSEIQGLALLSNGNLLTLSYNSSMIKMYELNFKKHSHNADDIITHEQEVEYYVNSSVTTIGNGSKEKPFKTISQAMNEIKRKRIVNSVIITEGEFNETVIGMGFGKIEIDGQNKTIINGGFSFTATNWLWIRNLVVNTTGSSANAFYITGVFVTFENITINSDGDLQGSQWDKRCLSLYNCIGNMFDITINNANTPIYICQGSNIAFSNIKGKNNNYKFFVVGAIAMLASISIESKIGNKAERGGQIFGDIDFVQLNTPYMATKMQSEGVYDDFIMYMDDKVVYDKEQQQLENNRQAKYQKALEVNPDLTYEEPMSVQPMTLSLVEEPQPMTLNLVEEPQPSEALKKFMEKYL